MAEKNKIPPPQLIFPALLLIAAFVLRLKIYPHVIPGLFPDSLEYIQLSRALRELDLSPFYRRPPGYPLFLSLLFILSGKESLPSLVALQMALSSIVPIFIYFIFLFISQKKILSFLSALFVVFDLYLLSYDSVVLTESLAIFLVAFALWLFTCGIKLKSNALVILAGLVIAWLAFVRPLFSALFVFIAFITLFWLFRQKKSADFKSWLCSLGYFFLIPFAIIFFWSFRNRLIYGMFGLSTSLGLNLTNLSGNFIEYAPAKTQEEEIIREIYLQQRETDGAHVMLIWKILPELEERLQLTEPQISKVVFKMSLAAIFRRPGEYLRNVALSWCSFWAVRWPLYASPEFMSYINQNPPLKAIFRFYEHSLFGSRFVRKYLPVIFIIALLTLGYRQCNNPFALLSLLLLFITVFYTALLSSLLELGENPRYRAPVEPLIIGAISLFILEVAYAAIAYFRFKIVRIDI